MGGTKEMTKADAATFNKYKTAGVVKEENTVVSNNLKVVCAAANTPTANTHTCTLKFQGAASNPKTCDDALKDLHKAYPDTPLSAGFDFTPGPGQTAAAKLPAGCTLTKEVSKEDSDTLEALTK